MMNNALYFPQNVCYRLIFLSSLTLAFLGCAQPQNFASLQEHAIVADERGFSLNPANLKKYEKNEIAAHHLQILDSLKKYAENIDPNASGQKTVKIAIYAHGGLVALPLGLAEASLLECPMENEGVYPIFIVWETSLFKSYGDHLISVRRGYRRGFWSSFTNVLGYFIYDSASAVAASGTTIIYMILSDYFSLFNATIKPRVESKKTETAENPFSLMNMSENALETLKSSALATGALAFGGPNFLIPRKVQNATAIYNELENRYFDALLIDPDNPRALKVSIGDDARNAAEGVFNATNYFITLPLKMLTVPIVDSFGRQSWRMMKRRLQTMFRSDDEQDITFADTNPQEFLQQNSTGAVALFMEDFLHFLEEEGKYDPNTKYEIAILGHSMGTMVSNEIIKRYGDRMDNLKNAVINNVVYMAAACSSADVEESVVRFMKRNPQVNFYNLCLHPIAETRERQDTIMSAITFGFIDFIDIEPRGSLLIWIDNYFELPTSPLERTAGAWINAVQAVSVYPQDIRERVTIKAFGTGYNSKWEFPEGNPQKHGEFNNPEMKFWRPIFWKAHKPPTVPADVCE